MDPFLSVLLLRQAIKLVAPIGQSAWAEFTKTVGERMGHGAAQVAEGWFARASEPGQSSDSTEAEMQKNPEVTQLVGEALSQRMGVDLASPESADGRSIDEYVLDAYSAVFWRIATLAYLEKRPIAVAGALQGGAGWITACHPENPGYGDKPPAPGDMWERASIGGGPLLRRRDYFRRATFFVRKTTAEQAPQDIVAVNREFRLNPSLFKPPGNDDEPLESRWHRVDGIASLWVQLAPDSTAFVALVQKAGRYDDVSQQGGLKDWYPQEWWPLMNIEDEGVGLAALDQGADDFVAGSQEVRQRLSGLMRQA